MAFGATITVKINVCYHFYQTIIDNTPHPDNIFQSKTNEFNEVH